jgi:hypothetical protein
LCPDSSVQNLKYSFLGFGGKKREMEDFIGIYERYPLWQSDAISLASCVGRWYLYHLVQFLSLLLLEDLTEVLVQRKEGNCGCSGSGEFVYHRGSSHRANKKAELMLEMRIGSKSI